MSKSTYVCQRCGCAVHLWAGKAWKHCAGRNARSCGKPPVVMERAAFEAWLKETARQDIAALRRAFGR